MESQAPPSTGAGGDSVPPEAGDENAPVAADGIEQAPAAEEAAGTAVPAEDAPPQPPAEPVAAPAPRSNGQRRFLSDVIVELGFTDAEAVEQAEQEARQRGRTVAEILLERGDLTEEELARAIAERNGLDYIDLAQFDVDFGAAELIDRSAASRYRAVPIAFDRNNDLVVAIADPVDALAVSDIAVMAKSEVRTVVAGASAIEAVIERLPKTPPRRPAVTEPLPEDLGGEDDDAASIVGMEPASAGNGGDVLAHAELRAAAAGSPRLQQRILELVETALEGAAESEFGALESELATEREAHAALETEIAAEREARSAIEGELAAAREARAALEAEMASATEGRGSLESELAAAREAHAALGGELAAEREARAALEAELASAREGRGALENELAAAREARKGLEAELASEREARAAIEADVAAATEGRGSLESELETERERRTAVESELAAERERRSAHEAEATNAREGREALVSELESAREARTAVEAELERERESVATERVTWTAEREKLIRRHEELERLQAGRTDLERVVHEQVAAAREKSSEVERLLSELEAQTAEGADREVAEPSQPAAASVDEPSPTPGDPPPAT